MRLIERVWFFQHPAKWVLVPLLLPLTLVFWFLSGLRRCLFKLGIKSSVKLTCPVVIVGNIGVGGNGKTPLVLFLLEQLSQQGIKVGVLSRGYGGKAPYYPYVLNAQSTAAQAGDEPILIYRRTKAPVVVASDRVSGGEKLIALGCQLIICDDGLQHYRLKRDYELIVVDGKRQFGNGLLLPAGPLRETRSRLNSVNRVIVNGQATLRADTQIPVTAMTLAAQQVIHIKTGRRVNLAEFVKQNPRVSAMAGIGDPQRFFSYLLELGFTLDKSQGFIDHQAYNKAMLVALAGKAQVLMMTEKDAVKCVDFAQDNWWYLPVDASFPAEQGQQLVDEIKQLLE